MRIVENENLIENVRKLKELGYTYIAKAQDKFLSGWGYAENKKHIQLIACKDYEELQLVLRDLQTDNSMNYVNWCYLSNENMIRGYVRGKSYTIRNDWTRIYNK